MNTFSSISLTHKIQLLLEWFPELAEAILDSILHDKKERLHRLQHAYGFNTAHLQQQISAAAEIVNSNRLALAKDPAHFADLLLGEELQSYVIELFLNHARQTVNQNQAKQREAIQLLLCSPFDQILVRPLTVYPHYDKVQLLFNLFPEQLKPFIDFLQEQTSRYISDKSQGTGVSNGAGLLQLILRHHKEQLSGSSYVFASKLILDQPETPALDNMKYFIISQLTAYADKCCGANYRFYLIASALF